MSLKKLREEVSIANRRLPEVGLVTMHAGNASVYDPESGRVLIKPSGYDYDKITPENLVEVDFKTGRVIESELRPSVDLPHHLYLYRHLEGVRAVIHTHSCHATAFAACHKPIPLCLTAIADEFGTEIPCTPYVDNEEEHIGEAILKYRNRAPAILLGNHGVFTWGESLKAAFKTAVMIEDAAKIVHLAMQTGQPHTIPPEEAEKWYVRYHTRYGQR